MGTTHAPTYIHEKRRPYIEISHFIFAPISYTYITNWSTEKGPLDVIRS